MANSREREFNDSMEDQSNGEDFSDSSLMATSNDGSGASTSTSRVSERLNDVILNESDGDLLLQQSDREDRVLHWLQALDMQVVGACRSDERLKPLLKANVSNGIAEDRFLAQLSQHFEPSEVGMLARCFCIPLVAIRVGKIVKQGTLLCPTSTRGILNLTLLPSSNLRMSFVGDDGKTERIATLSSSSQCAAVSIEEIPADNSGRSFLIRIEEDRVFYFWCSEKSRLLGIELLSKMKNILKRKPTIAELTGISESRLGCFVTHLRSYLLESTATNSRVNASDTLSSYIDNTFEVADSLRGAQSSAFKSLRSRQSSSQVLKPNSLYQGSLSPRSCSFKEGLPRNLSFPKFAAREKLRRHGDSNLSTTADTPAIAIPTVADLLNSNDSETENLPKAMGSCIASASSFLESLGKFASPPITSSASEVPFVGSSLYSPYYCWSPPGVSTLPYSGPPASFISTSVGVGAHTPSSSQVKVARSNTLMTPIKPLDLAEIPKDFPGFLPDPLLRMPMPSSQQIPTFTPLMCDSIVHIPVIDVCSSGQGYLVSAGSAISTAIPPLHPNFNPLLPKVDPVVEKGARETLRLLISNSGPTSAQFMDVLPAVFTKADEKQVAFAAGSRGLYGGTIDVSAATSHVVSLGLISESGVILESSAEESQSVADVPAGSTSCVSQLEDENNIFPNVSDGRTSW